MTDRQIEIKTKDGVCPAHLLTPAGDGPWPGVIIYSDIFGMRPAAIEFAEKMASFGYAVLLPDIFYRRGPYAPLNPKDAFSGDFASVIGPMRTATDRTRAAEDTRFFIDAMRASGVVAPGKIGATGYCFGGGIAIVVAGTYPSEIGAAASFHGGTLATDDDNSPHLFLPKIEGEVYVGVAENDKSYPPEMAERFLAAADAASATYRHELYEGAAHGWTQADFPIYDQQADDRHWREVVDLFNRTIG